MTQLLATVVLCFALAPALAGEDIASWRPWIEATEALDSPSVPVLAPVRRDERWSAPPSLAWNDVAAGLIVKYQQNPLRAARVHTYAQAAIHDALVECARRGCDPAQRRVAAHAAASRVLEFLYPDESPGRLRSLGVAAAASATAASIELPWRAGSAVAARAVARALQDGWDLPRLPEKRPQWKPGVWRASPPLNMYDPAEPHAGGWRTWVLKSGADVEPPPPVAYGSDAFWKEVDEVRKVAAALTSAQKRIAEDWNLDLGSVTPGGVWNLHAKKLAQEGKLDDARAAQLFAALNAAMMDAFIACWHAKYRWWTERPVTVIREKYDSAFTPHVITPAFPSYVSGHSSASGAAAEVLAAFFPQEATKLHAMAAEASISRLYGGIHFRSDNEQGLALGRRVGALALERIGVRPAQFPAGSAAITR